MLTRILAVLLAVHLFIGPGIVSGRADQIATAAGLLAVFFAYVWESRAGRFGPRPSSYGLGSPAPRSGLSPQPRSHAGRPGPRAGGPHPE